jgi:hypothetical protein
MKLVKYIAGDFDLTCEPKECSAVIIAVRTTTIENKARDESGNPTGKTFPKEIQVADLVIFQSNGDIIGRRLNVPHADDAITGGKKIEVIDGKKVASKEVHAYFEEYPEDQPEVTAEQFSALQSEVKELRSAKSEVTAEQFNELKSQLDAALEAIKKLSSNAAPQ